MTTSKLSFNIRKRSTTNWRFEVWLKITLKNNTMRCKRLATIVSGRLHLMVLYYKVIFNHASKRQFVVFHCCIRRIFTRNRAQVDRRTDGQRNWSHQHFSTSLKSVKKRKICKKIRQMNEILLLLSISHNFASCMMYFSCSFKSLKFYLLVSRMILFRNLKTVFSEISGNLRQFLRKF